MGSIVEYVPNPPQPLTLSGSDYVSDNGEVNVTFTTDSKTKANVMEITPASSGKTIRWYPRSLCYIDDNGLRDIVFNADNNVQTGVQRGTHARYAGHFQGVDDRFVVEAGQVKHYVTLNTEIRPALGFLKNPRLGVSGVISIDPSYQLVAMGATVTKKTESIGAVEVVDSVGKQVYMMPSVEAWDQAGNKTSGTYIITPLGSGMYEVIMCVPASWLSQESIVYPVIIDPTTIVSSAYSVGLGNGSRTLVYLTNGWLVAALGSGDYVYFYVSKDNGATWQQLTFTSTGGNSPELWAIASSGTVVVLIWAENTNTFMQQMEYLCFDATTVPNTDQKSNMVAFGNSNYSISSYPSIAIDNTNTVWVVYIGQPNSSSVTQLNWISGTLNGTTITWGSGTWVTSSSGIAQPNLTIVNGTAVVAWQQLNSTTYYIEFSYKSQPGQPAAWYENNVTSSATVQSYPIIVSDSNGYTHVFWSTPTQILHSYATTVSGSFTTPEVVLTSPSGNIQGGPSVAYDSKKNQFYVFYVYGSSPYYIDCYVGFTGSWSKKSLSESSVQAISPQTVFQNYNGGIPGDVFFMWTSMSSVQFDYIPLNQPPLAPTINTVSNFDATQSTSFSWTYNPGTPGDAQSAYQLQILDVAAGTTVVDTGKVASASSSYTLAANTLTNGKKYQWRVVTWESGSGQEGPWCSYSTFTCAQAPSVSITAPTANQVFATANVVVQFSYSDPNNFAQQSFDVQVCDSTGSTVLWDSGTQQGTGNQLTIGYNLANNTTYVVKVTATNSAGMTSAAASQTFSTSFTTPAPVSMAATPDNTNARIQISTTNTAPSGTQPSVNYNDIYRRNTGSSSWTRIATGIVPNGSYNDYAVASNQQYDYKITAVGANGTTVDSTVITGVSVGQLRGLWVHDVSNPINTILNLNYMNNMNSTGGETPNGVAWTPDATTLQFAGRNLPNVVFGEAYSFTLTKGKIAMLDSDGTWALLEQLLRVNHPTLCVRDGRGRMIFGVCTSYNETDLTGGSMTDLVITQTSYTMAV